MAVQKTINRRAVFAEIHQDIDGHGRPHEFSLCYIKKDGTLGEKARVSKSRTISRPNGERGYRGNVSGNHVLLLMNLETGKPFEVLIDLMTHYNRMRIVHNY